MRRVLLELCDVAAHMTRAAGTGALLIALCIGRLPYPLVESMVHHGR